MSIVHKIGITEKNNQEIENKKSIEVIAFKGIIGDRYFHDFNGDREQITLIESENIDYYNKKFETNFKYIDFRRNIITKNIKLNDLVGKIINVGEVKLKANDLCRPCKIYKIDLKKTILLKSFKKRWFKM